MHQTGELYYVGFDIHKKIIAYCIKNYAGTIIDENEIPASRRDLKKIIKQIPKKWIGAMEATMFTSWVYDFLKPYAADLIVANPQRLKAISSAKKKSDKIDAAMICDLLRVNLLPKCYMSSTKTRELRRVMRYRNFLVRQATTLKNRTASFLMECGEEYERDKLHGKRYFNSLLENLKHTPSSVKEMLGFNRMMIDTFTASQRSLIRQLKTNPHLNKRVELLQSIAGIGPVTALTWALEIDEPTRFSSNRKAVSYCGFCSRLDSSAGITKRGPLSKQRNKHLQWVITEAAKAAPRYNPMLKEIYERELQRGNRNRATMAVARKIITYLMSVDRSRKAFIPKISLTLEQEISSKELTDS